MKSWLIQDAEACFGEIFDTCLREGPQLVTAQGEGAAILVPIDEWHHLQQEAQPILKDLLLAPQPRADLVLPERAKGERRLPSACGASSMMA